MMLPTKPVARKEDLWKWVALVTAAVIGWAIASRVASGDEPREPALLPVSATQLAEPALLPYQVADWAEPICGPPATTDVVELVERALEQQQAGEHEAALETWRRVEVPADSEVWRQVAIAASELASQRWEHAAVAMQIAARLDRGNGVVHYYTAQVRLEQSDAARDWYDAVGPAPVRRVGYPPQPAVSQNRSMYEMVAMLELERSLAKAGGVDWEEPLVVAGGPTVGDLLTALGAADYEGRAHALLAAMCLDRLLLERAEQHLDGAVALLTPQPGGYAELGEAYASGGRHYEAARIYAKALGAEAASAPAAGQVLRQLWLGVTRGG